MGGGDLRDVSVEERDEQAGAKKIAKYSQDNLKNNDKGKPPTLQVPLVLIHTCRLTTVRESRGAVLSHSTLIPRSKYRYRYRYR